jgi:predicted aldo/keto reductase-like oxidoreductase
MRYIQLGARGPRVSRLGFGCMRFPMGADGKVDRALSIPMLHRAAELGVTYFDTAVGYCQGDSQRVVGEAFQGGLREKIVISTKNPSHAAADADWWSRLTESLERLRTSYIDIYNFHGLTWDAYEQHIREPGKLRLMKKAKAEGLIRHICCSFHDSPEALIKLAETGEFDVITVQYNLLWRDLERAIHRCHELGVGVVVMGPVGGGRLGVDSARIRDLLKGEAGSTPEAALRFVLAHPGVNLALSGMTTMDQVEENCRIVSEKEPFTPPQIAAMEEELGRVRSNTGVNCPACGYCMPCPAGVDIPEHFRIYNEFRLYGLTDYSRKAYAGLSRTAAACTECGACLSRCPQKLSIPKLLRRIMAELDDTYKGFGASLSFTGASAGGLKALAIVRNLAKPEGPFTTTLALEDSVTPEPGTIDAGILPADGSIRKAVTLTVPDGVGAIRGSMRTEGAGEERVASLFMPFFLIPSGVWRRHEAVIDERAFSVPKAAATLGYSVFLRRDADAIHARLSLRSALDGLAKPNELIGARVELYLDMRPHSRGARNAYEEGVEQVFIWLTESGLSKTKSGRPLDLGVQVRRTQEGCDVSLSIPFKAFAGTNTLPPSEIGLDWMVLAASPEGVDIGHPTYGHRQGLYANPRLFTRAFLA